MKRVLLVCLGNICRSTLAEGICRRDAKARGLDVEFDSAGTGAYHIGKPAHPRSIEVGRARGCEMEMRGRQVTAADFDDFDLILAMDAANLHDLKRWPGAKPEKVRLMREFDSTAPPGAEVPDPYYGPDDHYEEVADMLERASKGLMEMLETPQFSHPPAKNV